jgi:hypothetical protein
MGTRAPIWRHRWRACLVAVVASLIAVPQTASAEIGNSDYPGHCGRAFAQVLSPRPGGIVKGDSARIRGEARAGTHSFKAWLGPTDITRLFHREGDARVAELSTRRVRALKLGPTTSMSGCGTVAVIATSTRCASCARSARARCSGSRRTPRPRFRPDRVGTYRLRLTVNETGRGTRAAAAAGPRSTDEITLRAVPKIPPVGVPIDTAAGPIGQGVRLGAPLNQRFIAPDRNLPVQLVVLDRTDLSQVENDSYGGDHNSLADLANYLQGLDPSNLVILTTPSSSHSRAIDADGTALTNLNTAVSEIGGSPIRPPSRPPTAARPEASARRGR